MDMEERIKELLNNNYNPRRKIKINHTIGQSDPMAYSDVFEKAVEDVYGKGAFEEEFKNRMQGYSASLWTQKTRDNRIAWKHNPGVQQSGTFFKSFTLFDALAVENDKEIMVYTAQGEPVSLQSKPEVFEQDFKEVLGNLKNATIDNVRNFLEQYESLSQTHEPRWDPRSFGNEHKPLEIAKDIKREYRTFI